MWACPGLCGCPSCHPVCGRARDQPPAGLCASVSLTRAWELVGLEPVPAPWPWHLGLGASLSSHSTLSLVCWQAPALAPRPRVVRQLAQTARLIWNLANACGKETAGNERRARGHRTWRLTRCRRLGSQTLGAKQLWGGPAPAARGVKHGCFVSLLRSWWGAGPTVCDSCGVSVSLLRLGVALLVAQARGDTLRRSVCINCLSLVCSPPAF